MARLVVRHGIADLAADMAKIPVKARVDMRATVRDGVRIGNSLAKDFAKKSAGKHGKRYPNAFSFEMHQSLFGAGSSVISGEYGPEIGKPQGDMSFERGSRNQKPHLDLQRSADIIVPAFVGEVRRLPDRWFW
jgi:hypothetical protein